MNHSNHEASDQPSPVMLALREYRAALDAGTRPDRREFLDRYSEIADELAECLDSLEFLRAAAPGLSAAGASHPATAANVEGTVGDFRLIREVGRGGMGVVYEAVQISLGRRVALKVLPVGATLDPRQLRRFENEARAAAGLHHTHIVPVFGVGCDRGVPYCAMQFIEGRPLSDVIEQLRQVPRPAPPAVETVAGLASVTREPTDSPAFFRIVAALGCQAAEALDYAHQMGVVHCDVKPANLILDGRDHLWVTDFGLARIQAIHRANAPGDVVGTLRYISPEQAGGDPAVDPRCDVYSLGATLYELLTLRPAFPVADHRECLRQVSEDEPVPLRRLNQSVPSELETVVLKAMAKAPADRYATARELADDLRRFLDDRPVIARRPTVTDRTRRWARKNTGVFWGALVVLAIGTAGLGAFAAFAFREQARTQAALDRELERAREAEERFDLARQAADDLVLLSEEELADRPFLESSRQRLLESSLVYYERLIEQRRGDESAQSALIATRERVKRLLADLAVLQGAGQLFYLTQATVADELRLSADQRALLAKLSARVGAGWGSVFREARRLSPAERRQRYLNLARTTDREVRQVLDARQMRRFRQVMLQIQGTGAFHDREVLTVFGLSPEQRAAIREIEADLFASGPAGPGDPCRAWERKLEAALERIQARLTVEQRERWRTLIGEPVVGLLIRSPPLPLPAAPDSKAMPK
jgi:eukaryotic-like serine/threonine-protein kinase